jgi:predicted esterase
MSTEYQMVALRRARIDGSLPCHALFGFGYPDRMTHHSRSDKRNAEDEPIRPGHLRVQFIHGLEGSPNGSKARELARHFDTRTPAMDTQDFEGCVARQLEELNAFGPDVLVGSSFGGAVAVALLERGHWHGPTLLLAQAAVHYNEHARLPEGVTIWLVHGLGDVLIDPEQSRRLARTGSAGSVRLIEVDDDHPLHASVANGKLIDWVNAIARL